MTGISTWGELGALSSISQQSQQLKEQVNDVQVQHDRRVYVVLGTYLCVCVCVSESESVCVGVGVCVGV